MRPMCLVAEEGFVAAWFAVFLPVAILLMGLVMDVAWASIHRMHLQVAADYAALAGIQEVDLDRLARGECVLKLASAMEVSEAYAMDNISRAFPADRAGQCSVTCRAFNAGDSGFHGPPATLHYPVVCVEVSLAVNMPVLGFTRLIRAHADASLVPRH